MNSAFRRLAARVALAVLPDSDRLRFLAQRPALETWRKRRAGTYPVFPEREALYDHVVGKVLGPVPIQYLEFGVFEGASIRYFSSINDHPDSTFVGFDTFEGLPETWDDGGRMVGKDVFDVGGQVPQIDDERVSFVKGLFQDTLDDALAALPPAEQLVIHNDSDLYSATLYVLTAAHARIVPGTVIIFDEFYSVMHEFRALEDYCSAYGRDYEVLGVTEGHVQVAVRMT